MLPTKPQSVIKLIFNSIEVYKKNFIPLLIMAALLNIIQVVSCNVGKVEQQWANFTVILIGFFWIFCFSWATCLVYDIVAKEEVSFKKAFETATYGFSRVIALCVMMTLVAVAIYVLVAAGNFTFSNAFMAKALKVVTVIFSLLVGCFMAGFTIVYLLEVLVKKAKIFPAINRAFKISFNLESMKRMVCLFGIIIPLMLLTFALSFALIALLVWICAKLSIAIATPLVSMVVFFFLNTVLMWPLYLVIPIYLYNDLVLRFEERANLAPHE